MQRLRLWEGVRGTLLVPLGIPTMMDDAFLRVSNLPTPFLLINGLHNHFCLVSIQIMGTEFTGAVRSFLLHFLVSIRAPLSKQVSSCAIGLIMHRVSDNFYRRVKWEFTLSFHHSIQHNRLNANVLLETSLRGFSLEIWGINRGIEDYNTVFSSNFMVIF